MGLSAQVVYEAVESGRLQARTVRRGRLRYGIEPEEARRYAAWVETRGEAAANWHSLRRKQIAEAGLLTIRDLAGRMGVSEEVVAVRARRWGLGRRWGRYVVFEPQEVADFGF